MDINVREIVRALDEVDARRAQAARNEERESFEEGIEAIYAMSVRKAKDAIKEQARVVANTHADFVEESVLDFGGRAWDRMLHDMSAQTGSAVAPDFEGFYERLQRVEDSSVFLDALGKMLAREGEVIDRLGAADISVAYQEGSKAFVRLLSKLNDVVVAKPDNDEGVLDDETSRFVEAADQSVREERDALDASVDSLLDDAFVGLAKPDDALKEALANIDERTQAITNEVEGAQKAVDVLFAERARNVAGIAIDLSDIVPFDGTVGSVKPDDEDGADDAALHDLAKEVGKSFETYARVIRDNGLLSAFPGGVPCKFFLSRYDENGHGLQVPDQVEQNPGGDDVTTAIARMGEFNTRPYIGILDDDLEEHVIAFWYGFAKLAEFLGEAAKGNQAELTAYERRTRATLSSQARNLGMRMDAHQVHEYCEAVDALEV